MAIKNEAFRKPEPLEILGLIFTYFMVAKDIPATFRILLPVCLQKFLKIYISNPAFFSLWVFNLLIFFIVIRGLLFSKEATVQIDEDTKAKLLGTSQRVKLIRFIRSLGFSWLQEKILDHLNVAIYGTIKDPYLPPEWKRTDCFNYMDNIFFEDDSSRAYQYSSDYKNLIIRKKGSNEEHHNAPEPSPPTWRDVKVLIFASNFFWRWYIIWACCKPSPKP